MNELEKEENKIKAESKKMNQKSKNNIKKEIKKNYKIGIQYFENVEKNDN